MPFAHTGSGSMCQPTRENHYLTVARRRGSAKLKSQAQRNGGQGRKLIDLERNESPIFLRRWADPNPQLSNDATNPCHDCRGGTA